MQQGYSPTTAQGGFFDNIRDNRNTLMGLGMGLLSGTKYNPYGNVMPGLMAGAQQDSQNRYRQMLMLRQQQESERAQANADRAFAFQKEQADAAGRGYDYRNDADGNLIRIEKQTGRASIVPVEGAADQPSNPYAYPGKPMTEAQSKDALYANRMFAAEKVLRDPSVAAAGMDITQKGRAKVPVIGNYLTSENYQAYDQAQRDFVNATLRRESGAVISESEFDNARKQYFPQPGDSEKVLAQKAANRAEAIKGIAGGAGKNYRPPYSLDEGRGRTPVKVSSPGEARKLPRGTPIILPDGTEGVVP